MGKHEREMYKNSKLYIPPDQSGLSPHDQLILMEEERSKLPVIKQIFDRPIIEEIFSGKKENYFKRWRKLNALKKKLKDVSPDFNMLFAMGEFIRSLEIIYNYPNNENCKVYSLSSKQKNSDMSLFINVNYGYIEYQLSYPNIITVRMHRETGNKLMSQWKFADGECELVNKETEMLMERIIEQTMDAFVELYEMYYLDQIYKEQSPQL